MKNKIRSLKCYHDYYARLKTIALSVFEWVNLPPTCNARYLEDCLFHYGRAIFVNDENLGFLNLQANPSGMLNVYNEPISYTAFSTGYTNEFLADECVYIRNNLIAKSTDSTIAEYAERLANLTLATDVNINASKTPVLIKCDEKTRRTLETIYKQYEGNIPVIMGSKGLEQTPLECITTGAPFIADKLRDEKRAVWNEALEFLGLNTNPSDKKKERLIVNEVDANNEQIDIQCDCMLLTRKMACEEINKKFNLNVDVKFRVEKPTEPVESVGGING